MFTPTSTQPSCQYRQKIAPLGRKGELQYLIHQVSRRHEYLGYISIYSLSAQSLLIVYQNIPACRCNSLYSSDSRPPADVPHPTFSRATSGLLSHHDVPRHPEPGAPRAQRSSRPPTAFTFRPADRVQDGRGGGNGQSQAGRVQGEAAKISAYTEYLASAWRAASVLPRVITQRSSR